jgi:hypothetical protein
VKHALLIGVYIAAMVVMACAISMAADVSRMRELAEGAVTLMKFVK